jgi:hypothetical protein
VTKVAERTVTLRSSVCPLVSMTEQRYILKELFLFLPPEFQAAFLKFRELWAAFLKFYESFRSSDFVIRSHNGILHVNGVRPIFFSRNSKRHF